MFPGNGYSLYGQNMRANAADKNQYQYNNLNVRPRANVQYPNNPNNNYPRPNNPNNLYQNKNNQRPNAFYQSNNNNQRPMMQQPPNKLYSSAISYNQSNNILKQNKKYGDLEVRAFFRDENSNSLSAKDLKIQNDLNSLVNQYLNIFDNINKLNNYKPKGVNADFPKLNEIKKELEQVDSFNGNEYSNFIGQLYEVSKDDKVLNLGYDTYKKNPRNGDEEIKKIISNFKYDIVLYTNKDNTKANYKKLNNYIDKKNNAKKKQDNNNNNNFNNNNNNYNNNNNNNNNNNYNNNSNNYNNRNNNYNNNNNNYNNNNNNNYRNNNNNNNYNNNNRNNNNDNDDNFNLFDLNNDDNNNNNRNNNNNNNYNNNNYNNNNNNYNNNRNNNNYNTIYNNNNNNNRNNFKDINDSNDYNNNNNNNRINFNDNNNSNNINQVNSIYNTFKPKYEDPNEISDYNNYNSNKKSEPINVKFIIEGKEVFHEVNPDDSGEVLHLYAIQEKDEPSIFTDNGKCLTYDALLNLKVGEIFKDCEPILNVY